VKDFNNSSILFYITLRKSLKFRHRPPSYPLTKEFRRIWQFHWEFWPPIRFEGPSVHDGIHVTSLSKTFYNNFFHLVQINWKVIFYCATLCMCKRNSSDVIKSCFIALLHFIVVAENIVQVSYFNTTSLTSQSHVKILEITQMQAERSQELFSYVSSVKHDFNVLFQSTLNPH
jgi:hypothetical protein